MGDLNSKIGREEVYKHITGRNSIHEESNGNGKRLIELASEMNVKIVSRSFQRKDIYKGTWVSPDGNSPCSY